MRKNTARHWLHGALDLLPVILIPVFMIYSHRHTLTEKTTVDIQYKYQSNEVNSFDDIQIGKVYHADYLDFTDDFSQNLINGYIFEIYTFDELVLDTSIDDNYNGYTIDSYNNKDNYIKLEFSSNWTYFLSFTNSNVYVEYELSLSDNYLAIFNCDFSIINGDVENFLLEEENAFGYDSSNYSKSDFNVIESVDVQDTNSSIMNVFMDDFNYSVNKYFNMGNVFNLKDVYHWFEVNIFNNNPPVVMASIYNIIVYEFVMDLLFLLYGLFMWFIDMCKRLMEKPLDSIK